MANSSFRCVPYLFAACLMGCASAPAKSRVAPPAAPAEKAVSYPLRSPDAGELKRVVLLYGVNGCEKCATAYFGSYEPRGASEAYGFTPVVVVKDVGQPARIARLPDYANYGWVYAAYLAERKSYWGVLDYEVEGNSAEAIVITSRDDGKTWAKLSEIRKDHFSDQIKAVELNARGQGFALLAGLAGDYKVNTVDFGASWSRAENYGLQSAEESPGRDCAFAPRAPAVLPEKCRLPEALLKSSAR